MNDETSGLGAFPQLIAARLNPLQVLEEFCNVIEAAGEGSTAADWPQLHAAYERAGAVLVAAGWRDA